MAITAVVWAGPEGGVWYRGRSFQYICDHDADAADAVRRLQQNEYLTARDLNYWTGILGKGLRIAGNVFGLVAALQGGPWPFSYSDPGEIEAYRRKINDRLAGIGITVSHGVPMERVRSAARDVQLTDGLPETVAGLRGLGIFQAAASNDLGPFVHAVANRVGGVDLIETAPVKIADGGRETVFDGSMMDSPGSLVGDFRGGYGSMKAALYSLYGKGYNGSNLLVVGGLDPDLESMQRVKDEKGVCIGFNPDIDTQRMFERRGLPLLIQNTPDLRPVLDMARDPEKVAYYCV